MILGGGEYILGRGALHAGVYTHTHVHKHTHVDLFILLYICGPNTHTFHRLHKDAEGYPMTVLKTSPKYLIRERYFSTSVKLSSSRLFLGYLSIIKLVTH